MKKLPVGAVAAVAAIGLAPMAHADDQSFLIHLAGTGISLTNGTLPR
jgi:hypothetical protein